MLSRLLRTSPPLGSALRSLCTNTSPPRSPPPLARLYAPQWHPSAPHAYAVPSKWLGAYYTLREGDEVTERKRERLCGKRDATRGRFIVSTLDKAEIERIQAEAPWRVWSFKTGDFLEVEHRASRSDNVQTCVGLVIARHKRGLGSSFNLLCNVDGVPLEYKFKLYSPLLLSLKVRGALEKKPRMKPHIYYMRDRVRKLSMPSLRKPRRDSSDKKTS